jgi:23S rRNA pseudouridine2605 synthase
MKACDVSLPLNIYCKMKKSTGSGRRGGARRTKPESQSFLPKRKLKQSSSKSESSEDSTEKKGPKKTVKGIIKGGKYGAKGGKYGSSLPSKTRTGGYRPDRKKADDKRQPLPDSNAPVRLNRYVAQAGICSRRDADVLIAAGVVSVNGEVITEMGYRVGSTDKVQVEGDTIKAETKRYILLNKPKNFLTTDDDPQGRRTVMTLIRGACKERVFPIGRLDRDTTGLLLFTNDGEMTKRLTHPKVGVRNLYHASFQEKVSHEDLAKMLEGFELDGKFVKLDKADFVKGDTREVGLEIHSGRNRIVRRIFEHFNYKVTRLDRVIFACLNKKKVPRGTWRHLTEEELSILRMTT